MSQVSEVEDRLRARGWELPPVREPIGIYRGAVLVDNLLFVSGHGPIRNGERVLLGKVGDDLTVEQGRQAAQIVILNALRTVKEELGTLDAVEQVAKVVGFVNSAAGFHDQPHVIDAASEVLVGAFGERGLGARSAVGMYELPFGISVEIEMIVKVERP